MTWKRVKPRPSGRGRKARSPSGADVARALLPAHGTVKATGRSVAWSDTELAPLVPMQLEV